jgi:hypothetical protein
MGTQSRGPSLGLEVPETASERKNKSFAWLSWAEWLGRNQQGKYVGLRK